MVAVGMAVSVGRTLGGVLVGGRVGDGGDVTVGMMMGVGETVGKRVAVGNGMTVGSGVTLGGGVAEATGGGGSGVSVCSAAGVFPGGMGVGRIGSVGNGNGEGSGWNGLLLPELVGAAKVADGWTVTITPRGGR
jgi:hypothetical protein